MLRDNKSSLHWWFNCRLEFEESSPTLVLHMTTSNWFDREAIPFIYYFLELVILQVATKGLFSTLATTLAADGVLALVEIYELGGGGDTNTGIPIFLLTFTDYHCWLCHDFCGMNEENHHCWRNGKYGLRIRLQNTWNPIKSRFYYSSAQWKILRYLSPSLESEKNYWDFFLRILYVTFLPTCVGHVRHV